MTLSVQRDAPCLYVCPLSRVAEIAAGYAPLHVLTLLSPGHEQDDLRTIAGERHLKLSFHDISEARPGLVAPDRATVQAILDFARDARDHSILIHCLAGISRSSAAAYVIACDRNPGFERDIADELRRRAPSVTPNRLMVALADDLLGRAGRMTDAIGRIGRGADAFEGEAYALPLSWSIG